MAPEVTLKLRKANMETHYFLQIIRFVEVLADVSKHCKFQRRSLRHAPKGDFGTVLGKRRNAMKRN
jgi:hypothetical protein